jgi:(2Fe-2S) ferredoxin
MARPEKHILVCTHSRPKDDPKGCCLDRGGKEIAETFAKELGDRDLWSRFKLNTTSCLGVCEFGAAVLVYPENVMYKELKAEDVKTIVEEHLLGGNPVAELQVPADVW